VVKLFFVLAGVARKHKNLANSQCAPELDVSDIRLAAAIDCKAIVLRIDKVKIVYSRTQAAAKEAAEKRSD
jgi:uncharacterized lipoprotein YmbA